MKFIFLAIFLFLIFTPFFSLASGTYQAILYRDNNNNGGYDNGEEIGKENVCYEGLVPCGKNVYLGGVYNRSTGKCEGGTQKLIPCTFCHLILTTSIIINFVLVDIVPPLAVLIFVAAGIMFFTSAGDPGMLTRSRNIFKSAVIGLSIVYGAWIIIGLIFNIIGWNFSGKWYVFSCPIYIPSS